MNRLTPEQAERIRERTRSRMIDLDEMAALEKELGVRDPELEQLDADIKARLKRLGLDPGMLESK